MGLKKKSMAMFVLFILCFSVVNSSVFAFKDQNSADLVIYVNSVNGSDEFDGLAPEWNGTSGPKRTIKSSVNAAKDVGDNVILKLAPGMYHENGIVINRALTVEGSGPDSTIIDGKKGRKVFSFNQSDAESKVVFKGISFENAGCAIEIEDEWVQVDIVNCNFENNHDRSIVRGGAAIKNYAGSVSIENCTFNFNTANSIGGAIYNNGDMTIEDCRFDDNGAEEGGAISAYRNSVLSVKNTVFENNGAAADDGGFGGAICNQGSLDLDQCTFNGNEATSDGGAVCNWDSLYVFNCKFDSNEADRGGSIFTDSKYVSIDKNEFSNNVANICGGAICKTELGFVGGLNKFFNNAPDDVKIIDENIS